MNDEAATNLCPACEKPLPLCICEAVSPIDTKVEVIILRHPQEQDRILGTARIATLQLKNATLKTGLSWPNLARVTGRESDPKRWGILFLGTATTSGVKAAADEYDPLENGKRRVLVAVNAKGEPAADQNALLSRLEGIILLDGNWQQAKALWWRNAWMMKCRRLILQPKHPSLYGNLRREPRRESISTIEAAALALGELEGNAAISTTILRPFELLLKKARQASASPAPAPVQEKRWTS